MSAPAIIPARDWVTCTVHDPVVPSLLLLSAPTSPHREVTLIRLGPDCRGITVDTRYLANIMAGVKRGDTLLLPQGSLLCEVV